MTDRQHKALLFESVRQQLNGDGFVLKVATGRFIREHSGITDIFQLVCLDGKPGLRIQPNIGVRIEQVEAIFHKTSGFEPKHQKDTPTIGSAVGNITSNDNRACEFFVESDADVMPVTEKITTVFREFAVPYFARYGSIAAIDALLNDSPVTRTPHRPAPWLRCATGVIVARLVERQNYQELVEIYSDTMSRADRGFYLERFQKLVESLSTKPAGSS